MKRSLLVGPLCTLAVLAGVATHACACSCVPTDFYAAFAGSDAVFLGEVLEISSPAPGPPYPVSVTIRIETAWKGAPMSSTTSVLTSSSGASCGFGFRVGARYLVYANHWDGALWASLCSRTHETWPEDPDLDLLESPLPSLNLTIAPNPSLQSARLAWTILGEPAQQVRARLDLFDFQGRRIRTLVDGAVATGLHEAFWDGRDDHGRPVAAGIYWVRLAYGDRVQGRRLVRIAPRP